MIPRNSRVIVLTPGKAVPLCDYSLIVKILYVQALAANTGAIAIGGAGVLARAGETNSLVILGGSRPDSYSWPPEKLVGIETVDLSTVWIDAATANEGVSYLAWL